MKNEKNLSLSILITTINENILKVKKTLLPKLIKNKEVDEIIIAHQIFDNKTKPEKLLTKENVKYLSLFEKGV
jgi:RNase H-fold protein (predicted Holliday junction resolvase)